MDNNVILDCINNKRLNLEFSFLKDTHFVWIEELTATVADNAINIFLFNPNIILYYVFS